MFSLFSVSDIETVSKDTQCALSEQPINITIEDLKVVTQEWEKLTNKEKDDLVGTFRDYVGSKSKMDININMLFLLFHSNAVKFDYDTTLNYHYL
jgi:hypothetical protein